MRGSADSDANDEDGEDKRTAGQYDPSAYANLDVSAEVRDLFKYITRYLKFYEKEISKCVYKDSALKLSNSIPSLKPLFLTIYQLSEKLTPL